MAVQEPDKHIEEKPATHNKKAQMVVFGVIVVMLILVTINAIIRSTGNKQKAEPEQRTVITEAETPGTRSARFDDRFERAERDANKPQEVKETYEQIVERLKQPEPKPEPVQQPLQGLQQSPEDTWQQDELERVRTSRYDDYDLDLGTKDKEKSAKRQTFMSQYPGQGASGRDVLNQRMQAVNQEIARTEQVRQQMLNGQQPAAPTGGMTGFMSANAANPQAQQQGFNFDNQRQAGQARSNSPDNVPLPGQKLLSVGSIIRASMDQKIMSDYVGPFRLRITQDVYDVSNSYILIPQGSIANCVSMRVSNVNEPIQARMGYTVKDIVLPDGKKIDFSSQAGLDREGISAVKDEVDRHLMAQFLGVAAYALISNESSRGSTNYNADSTYAGEVGQNTRDIASPIAEKYLSLVPTITLWPGTNVRIYIEEEMYIYPWKSIGDDYVG